MAAFAFGARPQLFGAGMLLGLLVALLIVAAPEPQRREPRIEFGSWSIPNPTPEIRLEAPRGWVEIPPTRDALQPPWMADARDWPLGMVMGPRALPLDRIDAEVIGDVLSGLLRWLASGAA